MKSRATLFAVTVLTGSALLLTGCTTSSPTPVTTTPAVTQPSSATPSTQPTLVAPTGAPDPERYALTSEQVPGNITLMLKEGTKFVTKTSALAGEKYNSTCGYVFVAQKLVNAPAVLAPADQQTQSLKLVNDYATKAGSKGAKISVQTLNTSQQIPGTTDDYTVETESATISNKTYTGLINARVFSDGTGVVFSFLCRAGSAVPSTDDNVVLNIG